MKENKIYFKATTQERANRPKGNIIIVLPVACETEISLA